VRSPEFLIHHHRVETAIAAAANEKFAATLLLDAVLAERVETFRFFLILHTALMSLFLSNKISRY
jgi:hypothetical protein